MAHDGTGDGWTETDPTNAETADAGAQEIRDLRIGVRQRLEKGHVLPAASSAGGEHLAGSAKAFYQATAPTTRVSGAAVDPLTALIAADNGRFWIDSDDGQLYFWKATEFVKVNGGIGTVNTTLVQTTRYQAATDGIVTAYYKGAAASMYGYTDVNATPITLVAGNYVASNAPLSITFPVKKGDYWNIICSETLTRLQFVPLGG